MMGFGFFKNKIIFFLAIFVDENGNRRTWSSGPWTNLRRDYDKEATALYPALMVAIRLATLN